MPRSNPLHLWPKPGCLRWFTRDNPDVEEARAAAIRIVKDGTRTAEIVKRIRLLFKKSTLQLEQVDVNEAIREMVGLLRSEATRYNITVRVELSLNRMLGARGLSTTPRGASFHLALPTKIEAKE